MKNKKILIIVAVVIIIAIVVILIAMNNKQKNQEIPNENVNQGNTTLVEGPKKELPDETEKISLYLGKGEAYKQIDAKYNSSSEKNEQVKRIIEKIGIAIGYKIETTSIKIDNNKIYIDFKATSAPFNDSAYIGQESEGVFIENYKDLVYETFESINKTLKSCYGENTEVYYTVEGREINITNIVPQLRIDPTKPF